MRAGGGERDAVVLRLCASPNYDARPEGVVPNVVVVHAISLPPDSFGGPGVEQLFTNTLDPAEHPYYADIQHLRVSAHYFVRRDGEVVCFVAPEHRAWHAGVSCWNGRERCNDFSIGIELEGCDTQPFEPVQYVRLAGLIAELRTRYPIEAVVGHSDIAPGRKTDPGPFFDWQRLERLLCMGDDMRAPGHPHVKF
ncbi:1,6-anhydro-N-acetylmuramyl-L-alanine amidase AmpD [Thauera mechernichensis]|uniref:1,6-anhydro-N-acetylmuramyl-L-alanine amidase AmpD n=1 Tax=Thauera mechernichensis TaxID=82788 RepID=A0ABW3WE38_9RHOO|nr:MULTISPECIES: 1,6-anhydro-N-acetylmuramyl-L-alanine amidase AmpD [Thauera]ENO75561.1 N-acetyl-anhydromuranmyl-L-alanine amidase [Thauera sp. 27]ENO91197.1 N-acetyl-anhydromuranmyl-L-alanine amidase [Thauera sp. 28]MDG3065517.1 1,6-anhydro-N-acetylmuramyl-L-alanine amidase AmpD [Thauera mechernichensis]